MVIRSTATFEASWRLTTSRERPAGFNLSCAATSSVNSWRAVSGSIKIGGGGSVLRLAAEASAPCGPCAEAVAILAVSAAVGPPSAHAAATSAGINISDAICELRIRHLLGWGVTGATDRLGCDNRDGETISAASPMGDKWRYLMSSSSGVRWCLRHACASLLLYRRGPTMAGADILAVCCALIFRVPP